MNIARCFGGRDTRLFWGSELSFDDCMNMDPFSRISPAKQSSKRSVGRFVEGARLLAYVVHSR